MSVVAAPSLTEGEARARTERFKAGTRELWAQLVQLHDRNAHGALGYSSWHAYCSTEFDMGQSRAYQLLEAGRVVGELEAHSTTVESPRERQARELAPLRDEPDGMAEAWEEAVKRHGPAPTAAQTRAVVEERRAKRLRSQFGAAGSTEGALAELEAAAPARAEFPEIERDARREVRERLQRALDLLATVDPRLNPWNRAEASDQVRKLVEPVDELLRELEKAQREWAQDGRRRPG